MNPDQIQAPASPLGNFPELAAMYQSSFQLPLSQAQAGYQAGQDQVTVENQKKAAAAAEAAAKKRESAFADPSKWQRVQRADGGYGFYDPDGKEVSAIQYAQVVKKRPSDVLSDSQNPIDIQYIQDSKNLAAYYKAKANSNDPKQKAIAQQIEKQVKDTYKIDLAKTNHQEILNAFYSNYPTIYGANENNAPGFSGRDTFIPGSGGAQAQVEANNPLGFYGPQAGQGSGGGLGALGSGQPKPKSPNVLNRIHNASGPLRFL